MYTITRAIRFLTAPHGALTKYFLYSHCLCEPFLKGSCANIDRPTVKVEVALDSLVNGLQGPLSGKMSYDDMSGAKICLFQKRVVEFSWPKNATYF